MTRLGAEIQEWFEHAEAIDEEEDRIVHTAPTAAEMVIG